MLLPALLYYVGIYVQVHFRSIRLGLQPLPSDNVKTIAATLAWGWIFLIPLGVLIVMLMLGYSPTTVAVYGVVAVVAASQLRADTRLGPRAIYDCLAETTYRMIGVTGACAAAGLVIGGITMTGLAAKFSFVAFSLAGDNLFAVLLLSAAVTIVLGLGMPTPSAYVLSAVLIGPTLVNQFNIPLLNAHLFLMYFAVLSAMTPPVAVAAYAAAAISQSNPLAIAATATRLAIVAFVVPFAFTLEPIALAPGTSLIGWAFTLSMLLGAGILAIACEGWFYGPMAAWKRVGLAAGALALLSPMLTAGAVGLVVVAALLYSQVHASRNSTALTG